MGVEKPPSWKGLVEGSRQMEYWNHNALDLWLSPESAIEVVKTPVSLVDGENCFYLPLKKNGIYSVKSGYMAIGESLEVSIVDPTSSFIHSEAS